MKISSKEIAYTGMSAALMVAGGYALYFISMFLAVPGGKFILMAGYLSFTMYFPVQYSRRIGAITLVSIPFGLIMASINLFMTVAIIGAGLLADGTTYLLLRNYDNLWKRILSVAFYPLYSFALSMYVTDVITGRHLYGAVHGVVFIVIGVFVYLLGVAGGYCGYRASKIMIFDSKAKSKNE